MMPTEPEPQQTPGIESPVPVAVPPPCYRWYHKLWAVVLIALSLELGLFLLIYPWTEYWEVNYFALLVPNWHEYWTNMYVRGAVSGLGIVNLYISLVEVFRLRRFVNR